jgi:uncharacterized membrane protein YukC
LSFGTANAQVANERKTMSEGVFEALVLQVPDLDEKSTANVWEAFLKDAYSTKAKYDRKIKEYVATEASIAGIGKGDKINIHAVIEARGTGSQVSVWFNLGNGKYLGAIDGDRYLEAEKLMLRFETETKKEKVRQDIAAQEKVLSDMNKDLKKLESEKTNLERDIEKAKQAIAEAEKAIETNASNQAAKNEEIKQQAAVIETTKQKLKDY